MPSRYAKLNDITWIYRKYAVERLSTYKIADIVHCHSNTVASALRRAGIHVRSLSEAMDDVLNHNYGKEFSSETRGKMSDAHIGLSAGDKHPYYGMKHPEAVRERIRAKRRLQTFPTHHTKPELQFEAICTKYNLPFRYTGNSALWIGVGKKKINPDFVGTNGNKNVVVEIFGDWFHDPALNPKVRESATYEYRYNRFKDAGYHMIVFWESELKAQQAEELVLGRLSRVGSLYEH